MTAGVASGLLKPHRGNVTCTPLRVVLRSGRSDQLSLIKPCMQFSRARLSDVLHRTACAFSQPAVVDFIKPILLIQRPVVEFS